MKLCCNKVILAVCAVAFAVFLKCDCDFFLFFAPFDLSKKPFQREVVWITGASSGIGAQLAEDLTAGGAQVVISARREAMLEDVARRCSVLGHTPMIVPLDVTSYDDQEVAYNGIKKRFGKVDRLVLNAGRGQRMVAVDTPMGATEELFKLNTLAPINMAKMVVKDMIKNGHGQVVVVSSVAGHIATPISSTTSATKFALHGYFDALRTEVSKDNIHVSLVCPGPVKSGISATMIRDPRLPVEVEGKKMETSRLTQLMAKGMHYNVDEMWISDQPFLLMTYLSTYMPWVNRQLMTRILGPGRINAMRSGGNVFDFKKMLLDGNRVH